MFHYNEPFGACMGYVEDLSNGGYFSTSKQEDKAIQGALNSIAKAGLSMEAEEKITQGFLQAFFGYLEETA